MFWVGFPCLGGLSCGFMFWVFWFVCDWLCLGLAIFVCFEIWWFIDLFLDYGVCDGMSRSLVNFVFWWASLARVSPLWVLLFCVWFCLFPVCLGFGGFGFWVFAVWGFPWDVWFGMYKAEIYWFASFGKFLIGWVLVVLLLPWWFGWVDVGVWVGFCRIWFSGWFLFEWFVLLGLLLCS